jgi:hypothetical protein
LDIYRAWVPISDLPSPCLAQEDPEVVAQLGEGGYDWSEFHFGSQLPAVKLWVDEEGEILIVDGNHRLRWLEENGYTHVAAWVLQVKPGRKVKS